ncbi:aminopeptidase N [Terrihabitans sp. B22-R8]|uniref:aminopeptidase N n=1 Tax=Terrihabitans sp. B22-R8 TaxID=3425128 RepID=UPI00403C182D
MRSEDPRAIKLSDYRAPDFLIDEVDLDVSLDGANTRIVAELALRPNSAGEAGRALVLNGDELRLAEPVLLDGASIPDGEIDVTADRLVLHNPPSEPFRLRIVTALDPAANTKLMGLYRSSGTYCTQCEAEGFRRITFFLDRPDVLSTYRVRIEADRGEAPLLLSNGNPLEHGDVPGTGRHYAIWHDPFPKPSYLFALVGGDLAGVKDTFRTASGRHVDLGIYVEHGKEHRASYAMDALKRSMRWDEEVFGREYDLDVFNIVAVSDFNMGAMENKGLNVFNDKYVLASSETASDADYSGIEAVIAHEYFHNWTGNRITCRDWFQLCLKEGLTVFRDQEFTADMRSRPVERISDVRGLRAVQFLEDAGPFAHPVRPEAYREINNFYTATVYEKGAEVIRMLKTLIGAPAFRAGMDLYFERHDGDAATIEQFITCFEEAAGRDLAQFRLWYSQAGTPKVDITTGWDAAHGTYTLDLTQSVPPTPGQDYKKPMVIPLAFRLFGENGQPLPEAADGDLIVLDEASRRISFNNLGSRPVLSINRGFSAPIDIGTDLTDEDRLFLARHDDDPFNRWQMIQTVATGVLIRSVAAIREGGAPVEEPRLTQALAGALDDATLDQALLAQLLTLPTEGDLAREIGTDVDPDAIFGARLALKRALLDGLEPRLAALYDGIDGSAPYTPDAAGAGRRSLRGVLLDLLSARRDEEAGQRAHAQYQTADNMTDRMAALGVLSQIPGSAREEALADFGRRFAGDGLVLDKWFALQAAIPEPGTLERVRGLMSHAAFSLMNPNRVRSLIGGFASGNPTQFNRPDGKGHAFLAEIVVALDPHNPQVAARLLGAFRSWKNLEADRRASAERALRHIQSAGSLSADVSDLVTRALS